MTAGTDWIVQTLQSQGMTLLFPLAIIEGPIVSVIGGWLARLGSISLVWGYLLLVLADLVGDSAFYAFGRFGIKWIPERWRPRLGLTEERMASLGAHFREEGGRTLVLAKLTHSLGFAALAAAGAARMPVAPFLWYNLLGSLPKTLVFMAIGYGLGQAHEMIGTWIGWFSVAMLVVIAVVGLIWWRRRRRA